MILSPRTPQALRDHADECERLADEAANPATRELMLYLATRWRALADADEAKNKSPDVQALPLPPLQ
jgi:hypothetical protein